MRKLIYAFLITFTFTGFVFGQTSSKELTGELNKLVDQYNKPYGKTDQSQLVVIYVPGANNPFDKIYDKLKDKKLVQAKNIQFVGGFKEIVTAMNASKEMAQSHIQEAMIARYGDQHFTILHDMESKIEQLLKLKGYAIITVKKNKMEKIEQFEFDRIKFLDALNNIYLTK